MKSVAHLLDDQNVGGVTRGLISQMHSMGGDFSASSCIVRSRNAIPPPIDADVAVIHFTPAWAKLPFLAVLRSQFKDKPVIFVEHSYTAAFERLHVPNVARFRAMLKMTYRLADVVVAVSFGQADWLADSGVVPSSKLVVIQSASNTDQLEALDPPVPTTGPLRLVSYGRYCEQKGLETLVSAMRLISPNTAKLTFAGYGPDEEALRKSCADIPNVEVRGLVTKLPEFLTEFDAVVIPSRYEAFGQVAAEARSAARPVIASRVDGLIEQISDDCGILVPPEDPRALANAIEALAKRDLVQMGLSGRKSAEGHFARNIEGWKKLIEHVTRRGGTAPARGIAT